MDSITEDSMGFNSNSIPVVDDWGKSECDQSIGLDDDTTMEYGNTDNDKSGHHRYIDTTPGWGTYTVTDNCDEWASIMARLGICKAPSALCRNDLVEREFESYEMAELFYFLYSKAMGFGIRKGALRTDSAGKVKNRAWLCCKEGKRSDKFLNMDNRKRVARGLTREGCMVRFRINFIKGSRMWVVREFHVTHSHPLAIATHIQFIRSNRQVSDGAVRTAKTLKMAGVKTNQIMSYMAQQVGGYNNVRFIAKDLYNKLGKENEVQLSELDAEKAIGYLQAKADQDMHFFGKFTYDGDRRLENLLWADSRSRSDYAQFGNVLSFDTTYRSNQYGKPLLVFVGVNNHFRSTIFGFAVLVNETAETYKWALTTFLECMDWVCPETVITDGDLAMRTAIVDIMPQSVHRLCTWHIEQNTISNIKVPGFTSVMKQFMFRHYPAHEFERRWQAALVEYGLENNVWAANIFEKREQWADTYLRGHFFGGMTTTQRCEKMNSFLKSKVMKQMKLCDFLRGMDMALSWLRHKQSEDEYICQWTKPVTNITNMESIEAEAGELFTRRMFYKIRDEMKREGKYIVTSLTEDNGVITCSLSKYGDEKKERLVQYTRTTNIYSCGCNLYGSKGIPCRHIFAVLKALHVIKFSTSLLCARWLRTKHQQQRQSLRDAKEVVKCDKLRFGHMTSKCSEVAFLAAQSEEMFRTAVEGIDQLASRLRGLMENFKSEENRDKRNNETQWKGVKNPEYSRTKGGWMGSKRGGAGKKQCSNCHHEGHNKQTCTYKRHKKSQSPSSATSESDSEEREKELDMKLIEDEKSMERCYWEGNVEQISRSEGRTECQTKPNCDDDVVNVQAIKTGWWGNPL